ncbi:hypothetical protein QE152_g19470 [Popillia japonica]|uniref:Uncharacterized protein n=1 Tax=Popillia japonica TaxID=7064 RepID=A0AAW1KRB6_POPJA
MASREKENKSCCQPQPVPVVAEKENKSCCQPQPVPVVAEPPHAQVCFTCPPCIPLPTAPCPVKPLQLPCPKTGPTPEQMAEREREQYNSRYDNFYNNYNIDYHEQAIVHRDQNGGTCHSGARNRGVTVDGKSPQCEDYLVQPRSGLDSCANKGCPTGFKPCTMKLAAPQCCNPIAPWGATIMPCASKPPPPESNQCPCRQ